MRRYLDVITAAKAIDERAHERLSATRLR
jgi:hypothetical protein